MTEVSAKLRDDYSGPFDPAVGLADFSRKALAPLGREYLLHGHLQDRVGMPLVLARHTRQDMLDVAIEEWMAASPLYSRRTQRVERARRHPLLDRDVEHVLTGVARQHERDADAVLEMAVEQVLTAQWRQRPSREVSDRERGIERSGVVVPEL